MMNLRPETPGDVHVMPNYGRPHECSSKCWCAPAVDEATLDEKTYAHLVWVHRVEQ